MHWRARQRVPALAGHCALPNPSGGSHCLPKSAPVKSSRPNKSIGHRADAFSPESKPDRSLDSLLSTRGTAKMLLRRAKSVRLPVANSARVAGALFGARALSSAAAIDTDYANRSAEIKLLQRLATKAQDVALYREAVEGWRDLCGPRHPQLLQAMSSYSQMLQDQGDLSTAEPLAREVEQTSRDVLGAMHPDSLVAMSNLAQLLTASGKTDEAKPLALEAVDGMREIIGPDSPQTLVALSNLAQTLASLGHFDLAEPLMREDLEHSLRRHGPEHPDTLVSFNNLAQLLTLRGNLDEAEPLYRKELRHSRNTHGAEHPRTLICAQQLAALLKAKGRSAEALPLIRSVHGDKHPRTLSAICALAGALHSEGKATEAEPLAREAVATSLSVLGATHPFALVARVQLASVLRTLGGPANEAEAEALHGVYQGGAAQKMG